MSPPSPIFTGGCRCGAVRYSSTAPPSHIIQCHCRACQQLSGTSQLSFTGIPLSALHIDYHAPALTKLNLTALAERAFCAACGTPLYMYYWREAGTVYLTVGSVDVDSMRDWRDEDGAPWRVQMHIFVAEKGPWDVLPDDGAPRFDKM